MSYLLAQILICLLIAGLIGGIIGWLLKGGCTKKLKENDDLWEEKNKKIISGWEKKVESLMLDKEKDIKSSEEKLRIREQKVAFFEKQNRELTLKNSNLLLNEQKIKSEAKEELLAHKATWESKINSLWTSKESIKSEALNLANHYKKLKEKFLVNSEALEELKNKIAFFETQNIELEKKFTIEKLAFQEKEESSLSEINSLKNEQKEKVEPSINENLKDKKE